MIILTLRDELRVNVICYTLRGNPHENQDEGNVELEFAYFDKEKNKQTKTLVFPKDCRYEIDSFVFEPVTIIMFPEEASLDLFLNENNISEKLMWY